MNEPLEPLPKDIADQLATLVPPPMPPALAASLLPGIHAAAAAGAGAALGAAVPWWLKHVPAWVPVATMIAGALGGAAAVRVLSVPQPPPVIQNAEPQPAPVAPPAPEPEVEEPAVQAPPPAPAEQPKAAPQAPRLAADRLREERVLIEAARAALARNPEEGLAALDQHARAFPHGQLKEEREALAVQALLRLGRTAEARARFDSFARAFPSSPLRAALGAAIASLDAGH